MNSSDKKHYRCKQDYHIEKKQYKVLILMYHMISKTDHPQEKRYTLSPERFSKQMAYLKQMQYTVISLDDLHGYLIDKTKNLPDKSVIITLDDGYVDNYENALPILRKYNIPATIFIVSGLVGRTNDWMKSEGYPVRQLMGWRELKEIKESGVSIGSHTVNHYRLSSLGYKEARKEIEESKKSLEDKLSSSIQHFAYPYGDTNKRVTDIIRESGYRTACSTRSGFNSKGVDPFELRRLEIYGNDSIIHFGLKLIYGTNDGSMFLPAKYYMKRLSEKIKQWI